MDREASFCGFNVNFFLSDIPSLQMKRKGDGRGEGCEGKSWSGPEKAMVPWSSTSLLALGATLSSNHRKWLRGWAGTVSALGGPSLHCPLPQCCCGHRHQPVYAPPWGPDQEWGQEVREELLPEKGAEVKFGPVLSKNPLGRPRAWVPAVTLWGGQEPGCLHPSALCFMSFWKRQPSFLSSSHR